MESTMSMPMEFVFSANSGTGSARVKNDVKVENRTLKCGLFPVSPGYPPIPWNSTQRKSRSTMVKTTEMTRGSMRFFKEPACNFHTPGVSKKKPTRSGKQYALSFEHTAAT